MAPEAHAPRAGALFVALFLFPVTACFRPPTMGDSPESRLNWAISRLPPSTSAHCPSSPSSSREVVAIALSQSAELAAREAEAKRLEAFSTLARADSPSLRISETRLDRMIDGPPRAAFDLRVPIARPGTLAAEDKLMRYEASRVRAHLRDERRKLARDVKLVFFDAILGEARLELAQRRLELTRKIRDHVAAGRGRGENDELELLEVDMELHAEIDKAELARAEVLSNHTTLSSHLGGCRVESRFDADRLTEQARALLAVDLRRALSDRPEIEGHLAALAEADVALWQARAAQWPWLSWLQFGYEVDEPLSATAWAISLSIDLPFQTWDGAEVEAHERARAALEASATASVAQIQGEVGAAMAELRHQLAMVDHLESRRFDPSRLEKLAAAPKDGRLDPVALWRLEREQLDAEERRLEAHGRLAGAVIRLEAALAIE